MPVRAPVVPSVDQPGLRRPGAAPDAPVRKAAAPQIVPRIPQPGDRICANCREANDPKRGFCRRCGARLPVATAAISRRTPWWRRLFAPRPPRMATPLSALSSSGRPGASALAAGKPKPKAKGKPIKPMPVIKAILAVLIGFGLIGAVVLPDVRTAVINRGTDIVDHVRRIFAPQLVIVQPVSATATSEIAGHEPAKVIDRFTNTDWQSNEDSPTLTVTFSAPIDLGAIYVHDGTSANFVGQRRPATLRLTFSDGKTTDLSLVDDVDTQQFTVDASGVKQVQIQVLTTNGPAGTPVALSELEFFMKQ
jgi:hypothetical protein